MDFKNVTSGAMLALVLLVTACGPAENASEPASAGSVEQSYQDAARLLDETLPLPGGAISDAHSSDVSYIADYFPGSGAFDLALPRPHEVLGFVPGEMHITPEALHFYMQALTSASSRAQMEVIGYSHEKRPLSHVYISSPENIARLEEIRLQHLAASTPADDILVLKLAYSIHGNEPSGANAVPLIAYYLTASDNPWVEAFLARTIVIIEPVQNPDGLTRFAQWANTHSRQVANWDGAQRSQFAVWPSGRTNHYWFDLNRDWIFTVHPESQARIEQYHRWKPHVLGDYHEMGGSKPSYFFQPGHPKRIHPLTLDENQKITADLANFHASALDKAGQDYYSQERFDDFYYGKGSAYPDIIGGIGLLFEQTGVRGQTRDFEGERLTFRQAVSNQVTTSFSLMRGSDALRDDIMQYRFSFRDEERRRASNAKISGYIFADDGDRARVQVLLDVLARHQVKTYELARSVTRDGVTYEPGHAWIVPADATQYGFVTSLFETRTVFEDNAFYDVSTWNLPTAFNLSSAGLSSTSGLLGERAVGEAASEPFKLNRDAVAYAISWNQLNAPRLLQAMLAEGVFPRVAALPFGSELVDGSRQQFDNGTLIVSLRDEDTVAAFQRAIERVSDVQMSALASGLTYQGPDLGSPNMKGIYPVQLALLVGDGVDTTEAGSLFYFLDVRLGVPVTLLDLGRVASTDLSNYTHLLLADGSYEALGDDVLALDKWVRNGGILVAQKGAAEWVMSVLPVPEEGLEGEGTETGGDEDPALSDAEIEAPEEQTEPDYNLYQDYESKHADRLVNGAVFRTEVDLTHPYAYGYNDALIYLFRTWSKTLNHAEISYDTPFRYTDTPLVSGFTSEQKLEELAGTPAVALHRLESGYIVTLADDLVFRGIWRGSERIYANILYFSQTIESRSDE